MVEFAIRKPIAILMLSVAITVLGAIAFGRIPVELLPDISVPEVQLITRYAGASPLDVEKEITIPLERALATTSGLRSIRSVSRAGRSELVLGFGTELPLSEVLAQVKDRADSAGLPEAAERPLIKQAFSGQGTLLRAVMAVSGPSDIAVIVDLARRLEKTAGVAVVNLHGISEERVRISPWPDRLRAYKIAPHQLRQTLLDAQRGWSAGKIEIEGRILPLRLGGDLQSLPEIRALTVKWENGKGIPLEKVAAVEKVTVDSPIRISDNGQTALLLEVRKEATANAVVVGESVASEIEESLRRSKVKWRLIHHQARAISRAIDEVKDAALTGGGLTALMIYFILQSFSATLIVLTSIPLSILVCMVGMMATDMSFNTMSLIGMALGIGMIVDSAIVVLDSIKYYRARLDNPREAALWGARKVIGQVVISTLCTMLVFAPLVFAPGMLGAIFKDVSLVVIYSLTASIFLAILIIPPLYCALEGEGVARRMSPRDAPIYQPGPPGRRWPAVVWVLHVQRVRSAARHCIDSLLFKLRNRPSGFSRAWAWWTSRTLPLAMKKFEIAAFALEGKYEKALGKAIIHRKNLLLWSAGAVAVSFLVFSQLGSEFFPEERAGQITARLEFATDMPQQAVQAALRSIEHAIQAHGLGPSTIVAGLTDSHQAELVLGDQDSPHAWRTTKLQSILMDIPAMTYLIERKSLIDQGRPIQVEVYAEELPVLESHVRRVRGILRKLPHLRNVDSDLKPKTPELRVEFDRGRMARTEMSENEFVSPLRSMVNHQMAGMMATNPPLPIEVAAANSAFLSEDAFRHFSVSVKEKSVYLQDIATVRIAQVLPLLRHNDKKRMMLIEADTNGVDIAQASDSIARALADVKGINWKMGGAEAARSEAQQKMIFLVCVSLLLIYVLMASQFESLLLPLLIMMAIPFCLIGTVATLWLFGTNVSSIVFVGLIILAGSCVGTSIILVDSINQNLDAGIPLMEAILVAAKNRLRAVLLTQGTSVVGLVPLLFSSQEGAAMQKSLAVTIIGGLTSSTILTMLVIPAVYHRMRSRPGDV